MLTNVASAPPVMTTKPTDEKSARHFTSPAVAPLTTRLELELDKLTNQPGGTVAGRSLLLAANRPAALAASEALLGLDSRGIVRAQADDAADQLRSIAGGVSMPVLATDQLRIQALSHAFEIGTDISSPNALRSATAFLAAESAASVSLRELARSFDGWATAPGSAKSILESQAMPSVGSFGVSMLLDAERNTSGKLLKIAEKAAWSSAASLRSLTESISATQLLIPTLALLSSAGSISAPASESIRAHFQTLASEHSAFEGVTTRIAKRLEESVASASAFGTLNADVASLVSAFAVERSAIYDTIARHAAATDASIASQILQDSEISVFEPLKLPSASAVDFGLGRLGAVSALASSLDVDYLGRLKAEVNGLSKPWVDAKIAFASIQAFSELQGIGAAVRRLPAFSSVLTDALRIDLGDWRTAPTYDPRKMLEPSARTELYVAQGLNRELSAAADEAIAAGFNVAGLAVNYLTSPSLEQFVPSDAIPAETAARRRMGMCFDILWKLERELRDYIDRLMTAHYGKNWPKQRLPPAMLADWNEKAEKLETQGRPVERLIEVADFTDYVHIICRSDDFKLLFVAGFRSEAGSVRESFNRLMPLRLATMHARVITKQDLLYLVSESARLFSAMGKTT
jgi:hypothetical protein